MSVLEWDATGKRKYELGVSKCVLFTQNEDGSYNPGVAWNGITSISESPDGAEANDLYADNIKYGSLRSTETFGGTIEAYTYPSEWLPCDGVVMPIEGLIIGQQPRMPFGLCYRTEVGSDTAGYSGDNYQLHLVWNAMASPSDRDYETINDSPDAAAFSWEFDTTPARVKGHKPSSHLIIDASRLAENKKGIVEWVENCVYGTEYADPFLPTPFSIIKAFETVEVPTASSADDAYGVEWDYSNSSPALTRLGLAADFENPVPATSTSETGTSPFDEVMPWAGIKRYNIINNAVAYSEDDAGFSEADYDTVIYIPEFYYMAKKDPVAQKWTWAISPTAKEGFVKHPGSGRYVGRFLSSKSGTELFSKSESEIVNTGTQTKVSPNGLRTYSKNKGEKWDSLGFETWAAIQMLYLIEFANFNTSITLGTGLGLDTTGATNGAQYHTILSSTNPMYRWLENPYGGELTALYGIYNKNLRYVLSDYDEPVDTGMLTPERGCVSDFYDCKLTPYAFIPCKTTGSDYTKYVTDGHFTVTDPNPSGQFNLATGGTSTGSSPHPYGFFLTNELTRMSLASTKSTRLVFTP